MTHQLAYIAMMSAITVILSILTNYIPFASLLLILFLPFVAALVAIFVDIKLFPIYVVSSVLLAIIIDAPHFLAIIFYLLPAIISGFFIGLSYRYHLNGIYLLLAIITINFLANYATIPALNYLYQVDFVSYSLGLVNLANHSEAPTIFILFLFVVALVQSTLTYMIIRDQLYVIKGTLQEKYHQQCPLVTLIISGASVILSFVHLGTSIVLFALALLLAVYLFIYLYESQKNYSCIVMGLILITLPISFVIAELTMIRYLSNYLILQVLIVVIATLLWEYIFSKRKANNG